MHEASNSATYIGQAGHTERTIQVDEIDPRARDLSAEHD